jgi:hypothetical protein
VAGRDVEALCVIWFFGEDCFDSPVHRVWIRVQCVALCGYFEDAVEDDDELLEIGGKSSAKDIFLTLATNFLTEAPALEHLYRNSARLNCEAPVLRSL